MFALLAAYMLIGPWLSPLADEPPRWTAYVGGLVFTSFAALFVGLGRAVKDSDR
jgi:hypothetical protein